MCRPKLKVIIDTKPAKIQYVKADVSRMMKLDVTDMYAGVFAPQINTLSIEAKCRRATLKIRQSSVIYIDKRLSIKCKNLVLIHERVHERIYKTLKKKIIKHWNKKWRKTKSFKNTKNVKAAIHTALKNAMKDINKAQYAFDRKEIKNGFCQ